MKNAVKTYFFLFRSIVTTLQSIAKPSFLLNRMVCKRMGRKGALLSEFELFFEARNDRKKNIKLNNQTYL